jgi:twitching motility protein PilT
LAKIDPLFATLIQEHGSDLHLEQGQRPKLRKNGELREITNYPILEQAHLLDLMQEITVKEDWYRFENTGDLDFAYAMGCEARFRANYFRHFFGYGAIFRLVPSKIKTLKDLGFPPIIQKFTQFPAGLVLITGPTGSGKSTTLAAIINHINETQTQKIITIEEPVEFFHQNKKSIIMHREVGLDTATFASGLRSALKSDVNIILVGEMRDQETIQLALTAAEMGILVYGTLHTNSAVKTIDRIIDVFPTAQKSQIRTILANTLKGVLAQQLIPNKDRTQRFAAYEIMFSMPALGPIIQSGETPRLTSEIQANGKHGMILMDDCLIRLVNEKKITDQDAYMKAVNKSRFLSI